LVGFMLRRIDARYLAGIGLSLVATACALVGNGLTAQWGTAQFLPTSLIQALGQTLALSSIVFMGVLNLQPANALTFGATLQTARLFGGDLGLALLTTFVRKGEQTVSNILTSDVPSGAAMTNNALQAYAGAVASRSSGLPEAALRANALLGGAVRTQSNLIA